MTEDQQQPDADPSKTPSGDAGLPDEDDVPPETLEQLGYRIAETTLAERAEEGEVFPDLRRGRAAELRELVAGYRRRSSAMNVFEEAEIEGKPANCGFCYVLHGACEIIHKLISVATGVPVGGRRRPGLWLIFG